MPNQPTGDPKRHSASEFADSITGTCLCGSIRVTLNEKGLFDKPRGHLCHCANCRKVAGSYVASNMIMDAANVDIQDRDGTLKTYDDYATLSGKPVYRSFCSKDGKYGSIYCRIFSCSICSQQKLAPSSQKLQCFRARSLSRWA